MKKEKTYALSVDDYIVFEKTYYVDATTKVEAVEKFRNDEWYESKNLGNYFKRAVVREVRQIVTKDFFVEFLKSKGWEMRKGKKYNPYVLHKDVPGFSGPLLWNCFDDYADQHISKPNGAELWGKFDYSDGLNHLKNDSLLKV